MPLRTVGTGQPGHNTGHNTEQGPGLPGTGNTPGLSGLGEGN